MVSLKEIEAASPEIVEVEELPSTELTLGIGSSSSVQAKQSNSCLADPKEISDPNTQGPQNKTPRDLAGEKSIAGSGGPCPKLDQGQAIHLDANSSSNLDMDPRKLKRIMSNRLSAKRSRTRRNEHVAEMERQARFLEAKIALLRPQVAAYEKQQRYLLIEQHTLKLRMATLEREKLLKEAEMENMRAEINRLRALERTNRERNEVREMMRSWGADMKFMCGSSPTPSGLGPMVHTNSVQGIKIRDETSSNMQGNSGKQSNNDKGKGKDIAW